MVCKWPRLDGMAEAIAGLDACGENRSNTLRSCESSTRSVREATISAKAAMAATPA